MTDNNKPLISVIVPIYHVENYLERCIKSIINQTYSNLEILLVDDGSKDRCSEICDEYANLDSRITALHKDNGGLSDARNYGIARAKGEYIILIDSDDYIHKDMIQILADELFRESADITICTYKYVYDNKPDEEDAVFNHREETRVLDRKLAQEMYYTSNLTLDLTVAWNKLYKKSLFDDIKYPVGKIYEDEYTTYKLLYKCEKICYIKMPLYYYLQRSDSIIGKMSGVRTAGVVDAYLERLAFYNDKGEDELWIKEAMHSLHMMCYLNKLSSDKGLNTNGIMDGDHRNKYLQEVRANKKAYKKMSISKKFEICLYKISNKLYYQIWKLIKR